MPHTLELLYGGRDAGGLLQGCSLRDRPKEQTSEVPHVRVGMISHSPRTDMLKRRSLQNPAKQCVAPTCFRHYLALAVDSPCPSRVVCFQYGPVKKNGKDNTLLSFRESISMQRIEVEH